MAVSASEDRMPRVQSVDRSMVLLRAVASAAPEDSTAARLAETCGLNRATTWRILHAYLATLVLVLGVGHAVLTDGALDGAGTPVLLALGAVGVLGVGGALVADVRRRRLRRA